MAADRSKRLPRFLLGFIAAITVCEIVYYAIMIPAGAVEGFLELNAQWTAFTLRFFGLEASDRGRVLQLGSSSVLVARGCDGLQPWFLFLSASAAFPIRAGAKLRIVLTGTTILMALNIVRLSSLMLVAHFSPQHFELAHVNIWQPVFLCVALGAWMLLASRASGRLNVSHA